MKTLMTLVLAAAAAMTALATQSEQTLTADIPFAFHAGPTVLPAGQYSVTFNDHPRTMSLRNAEGQTVAVLVTNDAVSVDASRKSVLVFNRYGSDNFLAKVWRSGGLIGREMYPSKAERETRRATQNKIEVAYVPLSK